MKDKFEATFTLDIHFLYKEYMDSTSPADDNNRRSRRLSLRPEWRDNRLSFVVSIKPSSNAAKPVMDITESPLKQQTRPQIFEPKVVTLYRRLFAVSISIRHPRTIPDKIQCRSMMSMKPTSMKGSGGNCFSSDRICLNFVESLKTLTQIPCSVSRSECPSAGNFDLATDYKQDQTRQLLLNGIDAVKAQEGPSDSNALDVSSIHESELPMLTM